MQANYGSILGQYGEMAQIIVRKFFECDMIHLLGSDVHRQNTIYPKIPQILSEINSIIGEEKLEELTTINPKLVIQNKRIDIAQPHTIELTWKEKMRIAQKDAKGILKRFLNKSSKGKSKSGQ